MIILDDEVENYKRILKYMLYLDNKYKDSSIHTSKYMIQKYQIDFNIISFS